MVTRAWPDSLSARLFALVIGALLASHLATTVLMFAFVGERPEPPPPPHHGEPGPAGGRPPGPPPPSHRPGPPPALWIGFALQFLGVGLAAWFGARMVARPIHELAAAASRLGANLDAPPVRVAGPREAREAAEVFNQMQQRIHGQIEERSRFLAAVSHDLRTPLTRMRLRVAQMSDEGGRERLVADIDEMSRMLDATLDYLRGESASEPWQRMDVEALVDSIAEDARELGHPVRARGRAAPLMAMPGTLRRCLDNLADNAVRYGGGAELVLDDRPTELRIEVLDSGPGIPENRMVQVLQPFVRLEGSRSRETGGVGLGLAIAHEAARRHGGELTLSNRPEGGLCVRVTLPRMA
ncbi:MAG: HAMP domain-containing protein [Rhodocyclaceae bacterium]|nr:HAMP domain-containing protein [Rhodocyclaceae bacterium]